MSLSLDETRFLAALYVVKGRYPTDIFPDDGASLDCKSARMARLTVENVWNEYLKLKEDEQP